MHPRRTFSDHHAASDSEAGITMVEMVVAMGILSMVLTIFLSALVSVQTGVVKAADRSISNDEVRLAVQQIDREIRSGNVFVDPASESDPGMMLRIYSQANAPTRPSRHRCVQWRVAGRELQSRTWHTEWRLNSDVTGWRILGNDIVNQQRGVRAFELDTSTTYGGDGVHGRVMRIHILANRSDRSGQPVSIQVSVNGRNTRYGDSGMGSPCADAPPV